MLANVSIRMKLYAITVLAVAGFGVLGGAGFYGIRQGTAALSFVYEDKMLPLSDLQEIDAQLKEVRFRMAAVLVDQMPYAGSAEHLKPLAASVPQEWGTFKSKANIGEANGEQKELFEKIDKQMAQWPSFADKLDKAYAAEDRAGVSTLLEEEWPVFQARLIKPMAKILPIYQAEVKRTYEQNATFGRHAVLVLGTVLGVGAVLFLVLNISVINLIGRNVNKLHEALGKVAHGDLTAHVDIQHRDELGQMADHLNKTLDSLRSILRGVIATSGQVASDSAQLAVVTAQVARSVDQQSERTAAVASAVEEITVSLNQVAEGAGVAEGISETASRVSTQGQAVVRGASEEIAKIANSIDNAARLIGQLHERSSQISGIVQVIRDIADQTNLLALNAAIEAARAGEQGRGFAVVADEVRKLAERTAKATSEITSLIDAIHGGVGDAVDGMEATGGQVEEGVRMASRAGDSLAEINVSTRQAVDQISSIASATREQSTAVTEIAANVESISRLSEENSHAIGQMSASVQRLKELSDGLQVEVGRLRV